MLQKQLRDDETLVVLGPCVAHFYSMNNLKQLNLQNV